MCGDTGTTERLIVAAQADNISGVTMSWGKMDTFPPPIDGAVPLLVSPASNCPPRAPRSGFLVRTPWFGIVTGLLRATVSAPAGVFW